MARKSDQATREGTFLGFEIRTLQGWYVAVPADPRIWKVFEAESLGALEHKIRRWWVGAA
jgi:hypothetical protein